MNAPRILILDNYDSFTYNLVQIVEEWGSVPFDICKNDQIGLEEVANYSKILLSPGPGLPKSSGILLELIRQYADKKDILGVCLGHQAIAEVFGATLIPSPRIYHGEQVEVTVIDKGESIFSSLPPRFLAGRYHSWEVYLESLLGNLIPTAIADDGSLMAFRHEKYQITGVQFHPESVMTPFGQRIIQNWLDRPFSL
ncbi:MAG: aminodeoxychorismate/anthranilate synthase component II [Bacteroidales bacterium]|nr:aminodeoxychorismate/anthranilate synthase component II [Bacteroidales bacterium]